MPFVLQEATATFQWAMNWILAPQKNKAAAYLENIMIFTPDWVMYGSWFEHVKGWMKMKDDSRFFYVTYEEFLKDRHGCVMRICKFLGWNLDDAQIDLVVEHSTLKAMQKNLMSNWSELPSEMLKSKGSLMRKGIAGDWKNHFTVAQSEYFNKIYKEKMKDVNVTFLWEESS
ncbi:sulfotransferase 2B1-like [Ranitomeya variabilis]|uniref:sulfotransferase 2B1-like n=1 Tax=Ranitomeya variabilis TaxID=490064 RepID=UPI004055A429